MPRVIFLPGMGADQRLFAPQKKIFTSIEVPQWLPTKKNEGFSAYAGRMRDHIGRCDFIGGASFGGMMALEIAKELEIKGVILMGSARSLDFVPGYLKIMERLIRPLPLLPQGRLVGAMMAPLFGVNIPEQKAIFISMFQNTSASFLKWGCTQIMSWKGAPELKARTFQIHGDKDRILPINRAGVDYVIPGGGHLITLTHPDAVNSALQKIIA